MMAAMRLVLSLVAVVGDAGSRGSSGCEACVGLSARGCLDALGAALAALGDGSRVMVLETVLAGSDRCDGADLATCAARYDELVASLARPARLRRLRAACGGGRAAAAAAGAAAPDAFGAGGDGAAAAGPPWGVASLGGWSLGAAGRETATCAACDGAATRDGCVRAALAAHLDDAAGLAAVVDARRGAVPDLRLRKVPFKEGGPRRASRRRRARARARASRRRAAAPLHQRDFLPRAAEQRRSIGARRAV